MGGSEIAVACRNFGEQLAARVQSAVEGFCEKSPRRSDRMI
jgi:hypothetical protein